MQVSSQSQYLVIYEKNQQILQGGSFIVSLTNNLNMMEPKQSFPQNLPYIQSNLSKDQQQTEHSQSSRLQGVHNEALMSRVQELERNLVELNTMLAEDGGLQEAYAQMQQENEELRRLLEEKEHGGREEQLQTNIRLLQDNLLKQNEEMEELYRQLQEARNSQSRLQERGHSQQLESKVQELNEQISNLLVKIQELFDENNAQQQALNQLQAIKSNLDQSSIKEKQMQVENQILKDQIRNLEEHYMDEIERLKQENDDLKNSQRPSLRAGQIRGNTDRSEERAEFQQLIATLRSELAVRNEELSELRYQESQQRRKWEKRLATAEDQASSLNQQLGKLRAKLREQENKCSQYQFSLQKLQQQHERDRSTYKSSYNQSETLRASISCLEAEKEELLLRVERLKADLSQKKFEPKPALLERDNTLQMMYQQTVEELEKSKKLNKELKVSINRYQEDYKSIREDYQRLLQEKLQGERIITANQRSLQRHKGIYEQVVARCNATAADYKELEKKLILLEEDRTSRANSNTIKMSIPHYDKENTQLIQLENSTLKQEIQALKEQLSSRNEMATSRIQGEMKRKEREVLQELEMYRQKYLRELEKAKQTQGIQNKTIDLQEKLVRVNKLLNEKLKELQRYQEREQELLREVDQAYARSKMQFEAFGVRHHPQVKKLQSDLLATQRQLMESELAFKNQIDSIEDELKASRLENQAHRTKIDQLLLDVNRERNSLDYSKLARSLQLNQLTQKEMQRELDHKEALLEELRGQLKQAQARERNKIETSLNHKDSRLKQEKENLQLKFQQQEVRFQQLTECLNILQPNTRNEDPLKRTISFLSKMKRNTGTHQSFNQDRSRDSISSKESQNSRYEELVRKKLLVAEQFKLSQQYLMLKGKELPKIEEARGRQEKVGILRRLQENWAT